MKKCEACGQTIKGQRSIKLNDRFHGGITLLHRFLLDDWRQVKADILQFCVQEGIVADGGDPYPYEIGKKKVLGPDGKFFLKADGTHLWVEICVPWGTSECTNKQLMSGIAAMELWASNRGINLDLDAGQVFEA